MNTTNEEIKHLLNFAKNYKVLTPEEERELLVQYKDSEKELLRLQSLEKKTKKHVELIYYTRSLKDRAMEKLLHHNLRLVIKIARQPNYSDQGLPVIDLIQEGCTGFIRAVEKFEIARGLKLSTYATTWIKQRIGRAIENKSRVVRIPNHILALIGKLNNIYRKYIEKHGESPSPEEISAQFKLIYDLDLTVEYIKELGRMRETHISLDSTTGEDDTLSLVSYLPCLTKDQPEESIEEIFDKEYVKELIEGLDKEDRSFIMMKYGFIDQQPRSHKEMIQYTGKPAKENEKREKEILEKLKTMASHKKINQDVNCDVVITNFKNQLDGAVRVQELTGITLLQANNLLRSLPAKLPMKTTIDQHMAGVIQKELEKSGINSTILTQV